MNKDITENDKLRHWKPRIGPIPETNSEYEKEISEMMNLLKEAIFYVKTLVKNKTWKKYRAFKDIAKAEERRFQQDRTKKILKKYLWARSIKQSVYFSILKQIEGDEYELAIRSTQNRKI